MSSTFGHLHGQLTSKEQPRLGDDVLDVHWGLFCLGSNITASSDHDEWVRFTVGVLEIESLEEDDGGGNDALPQLKLLSQFRNHYPPR